MMTSDVTARLVWRAQDLRHGNVSVAAPARHAGTIAALEALLAQWALPSETELWRAMEPGPPRDDGSNDPARYTCTDRHLRAGDAPTVALAPGDVICDPLYLCATIDRAALPSGLVHVVITAPEGTPIVPLGWLSEAATPGEVLLARGTLLVVEQVAPGLVRARLA